MNGHTGQSSYLLLIVILLLSVGCAEIGTPPGGPVDQTPPFLLATTPANGELSVAPGNQITLIFSERIVKPTSGHPIFVSPRPDIAPKVDWKSDRIIITLADSFKTDQTYLVSVASTVADLRNNKLDSTLTIAFTTGKSLDSGKINGHVTQKDKGVAAAMVGLFPRNILADSAELDSLVPEYVTVTNTEGYFSFGYLSPDSFLLVAWRDQGRDEALNPNKEMYAIPDRDVEITSSAPTMSGLTLPLKETVHALPWRDTVVTGVVSALYTENKLVRVRLSQPIPLAQLNKQPANALLLPVDDTLKVIPATGLFETGEKSASSLTLYFGSLDEGAYNLRIVYDNVHQPLRSDSLKVEPSEDKAPPAIEKFMPDQPKVFMRDAAMSLLFSEPIRQDKITSETFALWKNDTIPILIAYRFLDPFRIGFTAQLEPGGNYRLDAAEFDFVDMAGNLLGDSLYSTRFAIFDADSLGSIAGQIVSRPVSREGEPAVVSFRPVGRTGSYTVTTAGNAFRIDLPAGKYLISAFLDANLDGELTNGRLVPYELSETRMTYADTVAVRARFETAGIELTFE